jgi:hypothetical protein
MRAMNLPNKRSTAYAIAKLIYDNGPMTEDAFGAALPHLNEPNIGRVLQQMRDSQQLNETSGEYSLSCRLEKYFDMIEPEAQAMPQPLGSPYHPAHKDWTGKYTISAAAKRNDADPAS